jgi:hypothetical protein
MMGCSAACNLAAVSELGGKISIFAAVSNRSIETCCSSPAVVKKILHMRSLLHQLDISSRANSTPPTGDLKAAATPAAAPARTLSALSLSFQKGFQM